MGENPFVDVLHYYNNNREKAVHEIPQLIHKIRNLLNFFTINNKILKEMIKSGKCCEKETRFYQSQLSHCSLVTEGLLMLRDELLRFYENEINKPLFPEFKRNKNRILNKAIPNHISKLIIDSLDLSSKIKKEK